MAEVFNIELESDLSEFDSTVTDGGDLSQSAAAALAGTSGGLSCLIDDTTQIYGEKTFTELSGTTFRFRFYVDPNGLTMANADSFFVARVFDSGTSGRARVILGYSSNNYTIQLGVRNDSLGTELTSAYTIDDGPHYVEVRVVRATGDAANDGTGDLWIDDVHREQLTGIDLYDLSQPDRARLGAMWGLSGSESGTFYLDEFVLRDDGDEIGPVGGEDPPAPPAPPISPYYDGTWGMPPGACGFNSIFAWAYTSSYVRGGQYWPRSLEWPKNSGTVLTYKQLCAQMVAHGANLLRLRIDGANNPWGGKLYSFEPPPYGTFNCAHKVLDPSNLATYRSDQGTAPTFGGHWSGSNLERLANACGSYDIKLIVAFFQWEEFLSFWDWHAWNESNKYLNHVSCEAQDQGFLTDWYEMFDNSTAIQAAKDRITNVIQSVGSTSAVAAWELFAEMPFVCGADPWDTTWGAAHIANVRSKVNTWVGTMCAHIHSTDPHDRPIATTALRVPSSAWSSDPNNYWNVVNECMIASTAIKLVGVNAYVSGYNAAVRNLRMAQQYVGTAHDRTVFIDQYWPYPTGVIASEPSPHYPSRAIQWIGATGAAWGLGSMRWTGFNESSQNNWIDGNAGDPDLSSVAGVTSTYAQYVDWYAHRVDCVPRHGQCSSVGLDSIVASGNSQYVTFFARWASGGTKTLNISGMTNGEYRLRIFNWVTGALASETVVSVTTGTAVLSINANTHENRVAGYLATNIITAVGSTSETVELSVTFDATVTYAEQPPVTEPVVVTAAEEATRYELRIRGANGSEAARLGLGYSDPEGHHIGPFEYVKHVNSPGGMTLRLSGGHPALDLLEENGQVEVWRNPGAGWYRDFTAIWTEDYDWTYRTEPTFVGYGPGQLTVLDWATVAWAAGSANRSMFTAVAAETIAKTLVQYNVTSDAGTANGRDLDWRGPFTVTTEYDREQGTELDVACSRQPLLETLQEVAASGGGDFDLIRSSGDPRSFEFRWYHGQRGEDRTDTVRFSVELANMQNVSYRHRGSQTETAAVVGGRGEGKNRDIEVRFSGDSSTRHREAFVQGTEHEAGAVDALRDKGDRFLDSHGDTEVFAFDVAQTPSAKYGIHYCVDGAMGDLVTVVRPNDGETQTHKIVEVTVAVHPDGSDSVSVLTEEQ